MPQQLGVERYPVSTTHNRIARSSAIDRPEELRDALLVAHRRISPLAVRCVSLPMLLRWSPSLIGRQGDGHVQTRPFINLETFVFTFVAVGEACHRETV